MQKTKEYLGFDDRWFWLIGVPVIGLSMPFLFFNANLNDSFEQLLLGWLVSFTMTILYWTGARVLIIFFRKKYPEFSKTGKRIAWQTLSIVSYAIVVDLIMNFTLIIWLLPEKCKTTSALAGTYLLIFFILAVYEAIYLYYQWRKALIEQERVKQEHIRSQLEGLRNQVNPHFLFNSLNTLMSIVTEDQNLAVSYLQKLSKVFRYVLESRDEQLIALEIELDFIENYIFLQKERFRENLQVKMDIPEKSLPLKIVPLSLQILFENVIKHNVISEKKPLTIEVFEKDGKLVVRNNLQRKNQVMHSTKVGLDNIRRRYQFFSEERVEVSEDGQFFTVAIPLLKI